MTNELFVISLAAPLFFLYRWAFKNLPQERWQVFACIPDTKICSEHWSGINLTYYGIISASAQLFAVVMLLIMTGAAGIPLTGVLAMLSGILTCCIPASGILARIVEKKRYTLTVGGAFFIGLLVLPAIIWMLNRFTGSFDIPFLPAMAATSVAYAFGEGLGRLACISYGCCYGKPLDQCGSLTQKIFAANHFVFFGKTKKIAYESNLDGQRVIPIQAISAVFNTATGLVGLYLFLNSSFGSAFLFSILMIQVWRLSSETMRKDYRGKGKFSAYQWMCVIGILYALMIYALNTAGMSPATSLPAGLKTLWNPALILALLALWLIICIRSGLSRVTGSKLSLHINQHRI